MSPAGIGTEQALLVYAFRHVTSKSTALSFSVGMRVTLIVVNALVGFGSDDDLVRFLQNGTIAALVVQNPFRMGYDGVKIALAASRGEQVPANVDTGANPITKANMNSARSQELLNPRIK